MTLIVTYLLGIASFGLLAAILYLGHVNHILKQTPQEVCQLSSKPWAPALLSETYAAIEKSPIDLYKSLPPRLNRRYIITGGNGLVGGYIVLQLLARGTPPKSIRIVDIRETERDDMRIGLAAEVDFLQTDITSITSTERSFNKPWDPSIKDLPLTVFHTAAVIVPSARSKHLYEFLQAVNVQGTKNVLAASRAVGATVFSSTSSASICVWPVDPFVSPWATEPRNYWQVLDVRDFSEPLRRHEDYFGNYSASKAAVERLVCAENDASFRTGCIRPANGVYGHPTDNPVGILLSQSVHTTWLPHIVQNFVHGANVAIAHLHHEAVLATGDCQQAGKPFVITDPGPPITFGDLYMAVKTLSIHRFRTALVPPVMMLLLSVVVEWYILLPYRFLALGRLLPELKGDIRKLQPAIFSICTHLIASDTESRRPVNGGGIGHEGIVTTLEGVVMEIMDWNSEHLKDPDERRRKGYTSSVSLAEKLRAFGSVARL
ncbi:cholesterol dehydrogenase [Fusarium sporotrichioides]|uniref:Cholesterol dehydrogenase n=1 Tax=Fusarium sporotrichioides TaxID=5514 RepID=A0A395S4F2_FUSSP|nr:cholesterol dehydrogenase [Fusarium sporotrichioides]